MMYPYYNNPYMNLYQSQNQNQPAPSQIVRVSGEPGARAYQMPANSSVLLLDEQQPVVWLKQTDGAGYPTLTPYKIEPYSAPQQPDYESIIKRIERLEGLINESDITRNEEQPTA